MAHPKKMGLVVAVLCCFASISHGIVHASRRICSVATGTKQTRTFWSAAWLPVCLRQTNWQFDTWVWLKIKQERLRRSWSMFPLTRVTRFGTVFLEPQPLPRVNLRAPLGPGRLR